MRLKLVQALRPLHAVPIENRVGIGTPDINYINGWIECKWLRSWPKRSGTAVKLDHPLMAEQRLWLRKRQLCGGITWVVIQCRTEWLILKGDIAADRVGQATRQELEKLAFRVLISPTEAELLEVFSCSQTTQHP